MSVVEEAPSRGTDRLAAPAVVVFLLIALETLFSVPYRTLHLATHSAGKAWVAGLLVLLLCGVVLRLGVVPRIVRWLSGRLPAVLTLPGTSLAVGLLLRLLWLAKYHAPFTSDGDAYFTEAVNLGVRHTYGGPYWPPGFSLFLSPFVAVLGAHQWVGWLCALLLFTATWAMARPLAARVTGSPRAGVLAGWLLAVWPGYIAVVSINSKEMLLACILTALMVLAYAVESRTGSRQWLRVVAMGLLTGLAALTQPGFTLFPAVLFLSDLIRTRDLGKAVLRTVVIVCGMMAVVLPWTARNYRAHHRYILISTNGGSVFYTANNARANASYSEEAQRALPADDIEADRVGYLLGKQWIREHPADFAKLAIRKQVVFLGDDGIGIYENLKRGKAPAGLLYNGLKALCSLYWFLLWLAALCCWQVLFRGGRWTAWFGLAFLPFLYQWAIDSVFESGSRHHIAYVGCLSVLVAVALVRMAEGGRAAGKPQPRPT